MSSVWEEDVTMFFRGRLCVPKKAAVKMNIFREVHRSPYTMLPGETKMYQDLKQSFWWKQMRVVLLNMWLHVVFVRK